MAKPKKKQEKPQPSKAEAAPTGADSQPVGEQLCPAGAAAAPSPEAPAEAGAVSPSGKPAPRARSPWRRWLPDLIKATLALAVIGVAAAIWYEPPLIRADFPYVSYVFNGQRATDAALYRPLAMPTRYYIALPQKLGGRYEWFAVDRRREVAALSEPPKHVVFGKQAIKRSDPLGLDLEFRKLDGSEWQIHFYEDAIVFSNAVLTVRLDTKENAVK